MKIGIEVEGRLRGIKTLFITAGNDDVRTAIDVLYSDAGRGIGHVYISDPENTLSCRIISNVFMGFHVTLDVTEVKDYCPRDNISIMFRIDKCPQDKIYDSINNLRLDLDQVKVERDRNVIIFPMRSALITSPAEFEGDIEI